MGVFPAKSVTWHVLELFAKNSRGIPYPQQLGGTWQFWNRDPNIADADRSVLSWTRPPEVIRSDLIGVDCSLANPAVFGGDVTSVPATAEGTNGATTDDNPG